MSSVAAVTTHLFESLAGGPDRLPFRVVLWDGTTFGAAPGRFTLRLASPDLVADLLDKPDPHTLADAYVHSKLDIEGDLLAAIETLVGLLPPKLGMLDRVKLAAAKWAVRGSTNRDHARNGELKSREREREAISAHYGHPAGFWKLWLDDPYLQYTCGYYPTPDADLETAQKAKLELVCRKLAVTRDDRLLDLGCGWGGLMIYAATTRGARVTGVTLSHEQAEYARAAVANAGVSELCEIVETDLRDFHPRTPFDKATGIGILEHVGPKLMADYFALFARVLRPGGLLLNQAIAISATYDFVRGDRFMNQYVFPDAQLMPLHQALSGAEAAGLEVADVEHLRGHYSRTLRHWRERLEAAGPAADDLVGRTAYRVFRLYLAACEVAFNRGAIKIYQSLLRKPDGAPTTPVTRADWHREPLARLA